MSSRRLPRSSNSCLVSLDLDGVLIQADALHIQKTLRRQIRSQFQGKRHIREAWSGNSWIVELAATATEVMALLAMAMRQPKPKTC